MTIHYGDNDDDDDVEKVTMMTLPSTEPSTQVLLQFFRSVSTPFVRKCKKKVSLQCHATCLNVKLPPKATRLDGKVNVAQESLQSKWIKIRFVTNHFVKKL